MKKTMKRTMNRRDFLKTSAALGATLGLGLELPNAWANTSKQKKNLVVMYVAGGWDPTATFDPKPGVAGVDVLDGKLTAFGDIQLWDDPARSAVAAFFDAWSSQTVVVNGINVPSIAHDGCRLRMLTGARAPGAPDVAALAGHHLGAERPLPHIILGNFGFVGEYGASVARVGATTQIKTLIDPTDAYPLTNKAGYTRTTPSAGEEALIRKFVKARAERMRAVRGSRGYNKKRVDDFLKSLERGDLLRQQSKLVGSSKKAMTLSDQANLAAVMLERGMCRSVMLSANLGFDTHTNNIDQNKHYQTTFEALKVLAEQLASRKGSTAGSKLIDETVVMVVSEMGRSPKLNAAKGKDHWPITSAILFGAGVRSGLVGGTDKNLLALGTDFETGKVDTKQTHIQPENLHAGVLELVGLDPAQLYPGVKPLRGIRAKS